MKTSKPGLKHAFPSHFKAFYPAEVLCTSQFSRTRGSIPTDAETGCFPLRWGGSDASCAKRLDMLYIFRYFILRLSRRWQMRADVYNRAYKTHTGTLESGSESSWTGVSCQSCRLADCVHIHHTHTDWNWQGTRAHTHTYANAAGKNICWWVKSILQGQPALLKILRKNYFVA